MENAKYLEVDAGAGCWEDTELNGKQDDNGTISCREGDRWCPIIELATGKIINWNIGDTASVHYKVCDDGKYYLLDENKQRILKEKHSYVPDILSPKEEGYGDYIIMDIAEDGIIKDFKNVLKSKDWKPIDAN